MKKSLLSILILFYSCSGYGPEQSAEQSLNASLESQVESNTSGEEEGVLEFSSDQFDQIAEVMSEGDQPYRSDNIMDDHAAVVATNTAIQKDITNVLEEETKFEDYIVQDGESLMILAFRRYKDIDKWKDIASWNDGKQHISPGEKIRLKIVDQDSLPIWQPMGSPYLVEKGDYLGKIAIKVYEGHGSYWRSLWANNKLMIKDPDLIFPGFTLYYKEIELAKAESLKMKRQEYLAWKEAKESNEMAQREIASEE